MLRIGTVMIFVASSFMLASIAKAADQPIVAVFQIEDKEGKLNKTTLDQLTEYLRVAIAEGGIYRTVAPGDIRKALEEKKKESYKECFDQSCQIELGKEVAANKSLSTSILRLGGTCTITSSLYDLKTQATDVSAKEKGSCEIAGLQELIDRIALKLRTGSTQQSSAGRFKEEKIGGAKENWEAGTVDEVIVSFNSVPPKAVVMIDGKLLCPSTPCSKSVPEGPHQVSMQSDKYSERTEKVVLSKGTKIEWTLSPNLGLLTVRSNPSGLSVKINGADSGKTPIEKMEVSPGGYEVLVEGPCLQQAGERVKIERGQERVVSAEPKERKGAVTVKARDKQGNDLVAEVRIDGMKVGQTPGTFKASVCAKEIEVFDQKFGSQKKPLAIREREIARMEVILDGNGKCAQAIDNYIALTSGSYKKMLASMADNEETKKLKAEADQDVDMMNQIKPKVVLVCLSDLEAKKTTEKVLDCLIAIKEHGDLVNCVTAADKNIFLNMFVSNPTQLTWVRSAAAGIEFTKSEVTVAQYRACVGTGKCSAPKSKDDGKNCNWGYLDRDKHPVNCVDWNQATAFCAWAGGRLPTEEEWYAEASNKGTRQYPWGNEQPTCDYEVMNQGGDGCGRNSTWPVCSKEKGNSVSGLCDMSGNVCEWTASAKGHEREVRGGSWLFVNSDNLRVSFRIWFDPVFWQNGFGFRCGRAAKT